jgi:uncharacterized membrane protein (UPF0127 family)
MISRIRKNGFILAVAVCAFFCAAFSSCNETKALPKVDLSITTASGRTVTVVTEIARSEAEQQKGYMNRKVIPDGTAMAFVFKFDRNLSFWMQNTPHPLSIAYVDSSGVIREIYEMTPFSIEPIVSVYSVRYAIEFPSPWFASTGIAVGDSLTGESLAKLTSN